MWVLIVLHYRTYNLNSSPKAFMFPIFQWKNYKNDFTHLKLNKSNGNTMKWRHYKSIKKRIDDRKTYPMGNITKRREGSQTPLSFYLWEGNFVPVFNE